MFALWHTPLSGVTYINHIIYTIELIMAWLTALLKGQLRYHCPRLFNVVIFVHVVSQLSHILFANC